MVRRIARAARPCWQYVTQESVPGCRSWQVLHRPLSTSSALSSTAEVIVNTRSAAHGMRLPADIAPASQPPSARPIDTRKSQLIRTYTSLLRTAPLILFFQHSNLTAVEWAALRRELKKAVSEVPAIVPEDGSEPMDVASNTHLTVVRTNMLRVALKIVEFFDPKAAAAHTSTARTPRGPLTHDLSGAAYDALRSLEVPSDSAYAQMEPVLVGPLAALVMPSVSPAHLAAALSILSPVPGKFPAPTRKKNPGYHDAVCQSGLSKLVLVGGRVESTVFDQEGVNWVGGIQGGLDGLRAQLVHVLQGASLSISETLEGGSRNLWMTLESRKGQLEDDAH